MLLAAVAGLALWSDRPPDPAPADAPAGEFSAARAMPVVDDIAREPHPLGSPASDRVRDDLVGRLQGLGVTTRVDATAGVQGQQGEVRAAAVENVVGTIPGTGHGTAGAGRVVLAAHADSVAGGPGAADDSSSVAAILETVRALRAGPPLRDDVVVLFTDGEEAGLLGAQAWVRDHLDREPTVVLNQEARGVSGPSLMFQTSPGDAGLVRTIASSVPHPHGDSSLVAIYRLLPNDTDLSEVLDAGRPGVNSAFIERPSEYHTAGDSPANLSAASVQSQGSTMLALTRALGSQDLRPLDPVSSGLPPRSDPRDDAVYFRFLGALVTYSQVWVWPVALLAAAAVGGVVVLGRRRGLLTVRGVATAIATTPLPCAAGLGLGAALWTGLEVARPAYGDIGPFLGRPGAYEAADAGVAALVILLWYLPLRRRLGPLTAGTGAVALLAVLGLVTAALVPGASFLLAWPASGLAVGLGAAVLLRARPRAAVAAIAVGAVPAFVLLLPFAIELFGVAGVSYGLAVPAFVLLGLPLVPLLDPPCLSAVRCAPLGRRALVLPAVAATAVVVLTGLGLAVDRPDAAQPQASHLAYVVDADTGVARWVTRDLAPAPWTARYADGPPTTSPVRPGTTVRTGPAPPLPMPPPTATVLARGPSRIVLALASPRGARALTLRTDVPVADATVEFPGRPVVSASPGPVRADPRPSQVTLDAVPPAGVRVTLTLARPGPVRMMLEDRTDGLGVVPGFVGRPPDLRRSPKPDSDQVVVRRFVG